MKIHPLRSWTVSLPEATALQRELAIRVRVRRRLARCRLIAGADISYNRFSPTMYAAVVVLRMDDLSIVEVRGAVAEATFRYQPGYLSFREAPALLAAFARVTSKPDAVLLDGQGRPIRAAGPGLARGSVAPETDRRLRQEPPDRPVRRPADDHRLERCRSCTGTNSSARWCGPRPG